MKCPLCGHEFRKEDTQTPCQGCPLARGCHMVKCPRCGYEVPEEPGIVKAIKSWRHKNGGTQRKS